MKSISEQLTKLVERLEKVEPRFQAVFNERQAILSEISTLSAGGAASKEAGMYIEPTKKLKAPKPSSNLGARIITLLAEEPLDGSELASKTDAGAQKVSVSLFHLRKRGDVMLDAGSGKYSLSASKESLA